jgi:hypothetical protein
MQETVEALMKNERGEGRGFQERMKLSAYHKKMLHF